MRASLFPGISLSDIVGYIITDVINAIAIVTPLFIAFEINSNEFISIFLFFSSKNFSLIKSFSVGNLLKINSSKNFKLS